MQGDCADYPPAGSLLMRSNDLHAGHMQVQDPSTGAVCTWLAAFFFMHSAHVLIGDVQVRDPVTGAVYICLEARLSQIPGAVPQPEKGVSKEMAGSKEKVGSKKKTKPGPPAAAFEVRPQLTRGTDMVYTCSTVSG